MIRDANRTDFIQKVLREESLDALVCSLPSNVLLLTGHWPVIGNTLAIATREPRTVLIVPEEEHALAREGFADEIYTFESGSLEHLHTSRKAVSDALAKIGRSLAISGGRVGFESGAMVEPVSYAAMHLYGATMTDLLAEALPLAHLIPASDALARLQAVKTPLEIDRVRKACQIAATAFDRGAARLKPDLNERQAAEEFHRGLVADPSFDEPGRLGGFTWCMSGPNSAKAYAAYAYSGQRLLARGDLVLIHCNSYVDGIWTDITRTYNLSSVDDRIHQMYEAVFESRAAALMAIRPGVTGAEVDKAARQVLADHGWGDAFKHQTGHGIGFGAISAQARPRLHPKSPDVLQQGMVFNVEPAVYVGDYGGLRHCDTVALTSSGVEVLTPFQTSLEELTLSTPKDSSNRFLSKTTSP